MELFAVDKTSLSVENNILTAIKRGLQKTVEEAKSVQVSLPGLGPNIYKITITVEQVEPKL